MDTRKYEAMKQAYLQVLPKAAPGLTFKEVLGQLVNYLPEDLFSGGATDVWWVKTVQLDLEARQIVKREDVSPIRWHRDDVRAARRKMLNVLTW